MEINVNCSDPVFHSYTTVTAFQRTMRTTDRTHVFKEWNVPCNDGRRNSQSYQRDVGQKTIMKVVMVCWKYTTTQPLTLTMIFAVIVRKRRDCIDPKNRSSVVDVHLNECQRYRCWELATTPLSSASLGDGWIWFSKTVPHSIRIHVETAEQPAVRQQSN